MDSTVGSVKATIFVKGAAWEKSTTLGSHREKECLERVLRHERPGLGLSQWRRTVYRESPIRDYQGLSDAVGNHKHRSIRQSVRGCVGMSSKARERLGKVEAPNPPTALHAQGESGTGRRCHQATEM